jgi:di/tricarboxylate transporter
LEHWIVFAVLLAVLVLFVSDRFRYEGVALSALVLLVLVGVIKPSEAFEGFGHPAVITVAAVLVISRGLANAGLVDLIARPVMAVPGGAGVQVAMFASVVAFLSAFMNNVGALALLMPVAIRMAQQRNVAPSVVLMPMAFASLLGGLMTSIGTPPNLIVAQYRGRIGDSAFAMFDFLPVGVVIAVTGVIFLALIGWRLLPQRSGGSGEEISFEVDEYITEVRVPEEHKLVGETLHAVTEALGDAVSLLGLVRGKRSMPARNHYERIQAGDVLIVEADAKDLKEAVDKLGLELAARGEDAEALIKSGNLHLAEAVVLPDSRISGQTASGLRLRMRFGINLLGVSRQGSRVRRRLGRMRLMPGDVLLIEADREILGESLAQLGCLPLADRDLQLGQPRRVLAAGGLFAAAIAIATTGLVPIHVSFVACALIMAASGMVTARESYRAIDWPVLILLGAMIPVGAALESSGGAALIAETLGTLVGDLSPVVALVAVLVITMCLSDVVNNAAAAVLMCPIAAGLASRLEISADPMLMAVAVGASCAFLTPVGHQSNTLVMGPGGYRFGDYWRVGLPVQILVGVSGTLMILLIWPF